MQGKQMCRSGHISREAISTLCSQANMCTIPYSLHVSKAKRTLAKSKFYLGPTQHRLSFIKEKKNSYG